MLLLRPSSREKILGRFGDKNFLTIFDPMPLGDFQKSPFSSVKKEVV